MFHSPSVGVAQAQKKRATWTQLFFCRHFLGAGNASLSPTSRQLFSVPALGHNSSSALPRCRQRFASAYQPPAIFRSCSPPGQSTPRGFEPLRAEHNGFRVHLLSRSDTVSSACTHTPCKLGYRFFFACLPSLQSLWFSLVYSTQSSSTCLFNGKKTGIPVSKKHTKT